MSKCRLTYKQQLIYKSTHWNVRVKFSSSNYGPILIVERIDIAAKLMLPVAFPWNIFPIDHYFRRSTGKTISIIEQTPGNQSTGNNGKAIIPFYRTAWAICEFHPIAQLLIASTFDIPVQHQQIPLFSKRRHRNSSSKTDTSIQWPGN